MGRIDFTAIEEDWEKFQQIINNMVAKATEQGTLMAKNFRTADEKKRLTELEEDLIVANRASQEVLDKMYIDLKDADKEAQKMKDANALMQDLREMDSGAVALYTVLTKNKYRLIVITPNSRKDFEHPIKAEELERKVKAFRKVLYDEKNPLARQNPLPLARELYKIEITQEP